MPSIHQQMAKRAGTGSPKASRKGRWIIIVVCLLLVGGGVAAGVVYALNHQPVDPRLAEVRDMRAEIMKDGELPDMRNPLNIVKGLAIYAKVKALPPELQQKFMEDMGNQMRDKMGARVKLVMSLPDDQRLAELLLKGVATSEAAERLGLTYTNTAVRIYRLRQLARNAMKTG